MDQDEPYGDCLTYGPGHCNTWADWRRDKSVDPELNSGKFKVDMLAGRTVTELMKSGEERVRLDAARYYTARRMGWKESNVSEHVGKDAVAHESLDLGGWYASDAAGFGFAILQNRMRNIVPQLKIHWLSAQAGASVSP